MAKIGLDELADAYKRVRRSIARNMEDAADFDNQPIFDALDKNQTIVDAAFFVLIFGQLENRINALAQQKISDSKQRQALREGKFEKRLEIALRNQSDLRMEIEGWYRVRNDAAHGESIASGYEIEAVLERAREIEKLLGGG
ncbi:hypothetical protein [Methylovirgula sp. HY1]|uniref:hypothetical protein n=1 Tax=Methylovirgula sp. HY1 TaxID=2822761 RepID=UPI001C5A9DA5|nr:hypothetical protein [Methylovirgula sp. HY1]QXX73935.1 hypothetical protein MHY1_00736 [Methylovirgula sp. HY1]